jgi:hypothetical protein
MASSPDSPEAVALGRTVGAAAALSPDLQG